MKLLVLFFLTLNLQAQTMEAREKKDDMLTRIDDMRKLAQEAATFFDELKLTEGCKNLKTLNELYPNHLTDIATKMDIFAPKVQILKNEALNNLKNITKYQSRCDRKENFAAVDPEAARKLLKKVAKNLKKHRRVIKRKDTDYNNSYYYYFEYQDN